ncbi:MAG: DNA methyltransferase [Chloroflexi bacterium]|nr:DNA methyltransferase [Chloroflexota bacterium]
MYLHCDPTAGHYLKLLMDAIYGRKNFYNEIIWHYGKWTNAARHFQKNHDTLLVFAKQFGKHTFNKLQKSEESYHYEKGWHTNTVGNGISQLIVYDRDKAKEKIESGIYDKIVYRDGTKYAALPDVWEIPIINPMSLERLGYPTQKPLALMERIIRASSNEGDTVLDPFCGCGTTVHAAEALGRKWLGIDISKFSTGLIRDRILHNFKYLNADDLDMRGTPDSVPEARELARQDPFEFEKWVCGYIGAEGMFREPGERGADGGVDGVLKFFPIREGKKIKPEYAIVQVKGGRVSADNVKALHETVRRYEATAGVMVCFADQLGTVENQRVKATFKDAWGSYPIIQGFSVESLLSDGQLDLPLYGYKRRGAMLGL